MNMGRELRAAFMANPTPELQAQITQLDDYRRQIALIEGMSHPYYNAQRQATANYIRAREKLGKHP